MKLLHVDVNSPGTCDEVGVFSEKGRGLAEGWSGREASLQRLYLSCGSGGRKACGFTAPFQCTESRNSERGGRGGRQGLDRARPCRSSEGFWIFKHCNIHTI